MHLKISGQDWPTPIMGNTGAELLPAKTEFFLLEEEDTQLDWSPSLRNTIQRKICGIVITHLSHWYTIRIIHQWICNKAVSGAISTLFIGLAEDDLIFFRRRISSELSNLTTFNWQRLGIFCSKLTLYFKCLNLVRSKSLISKINVEDSVPFNNFNHLLLEQSSNILASNRKISGKLKLKLVFYLSTTIKIESSNFTNFLAR